MTRILFSVLTVIFLACSVSTALAQYSDQPAIPNPASVYCIDHGGKDKIMTNPDGSQFGICKFPDSSQCEEWQYFQGQCNSGQIFESPHLQVKQGIDPLDIKCKQGLQLVIKSRDGSPACVSTQSATKLVKWGWASKIISPTAGDKNSQSSNNYTSTSLHRTVFFMKPNSTGTIIVRYHATWDYSKMIDVTQGLSVYDATNFRPISNPDLTVSVSPQLIGHKNGENYDVTYTFVAKPNAKGIFGIDTSCAENMDVVVGIDPSQIQPSDVPISGIGAATCVITGFIDVQEIGLNNITAKEMSAITAQ